VGRDPDPHVSAPLSLPEARGRLHTRIRTVLATYLAESVATYDTASGRTAAGRGTPLPRHVYVGLDLAPRDPVESVIDLMPVLMVTSTAGVADDATSTTDATDETVTLGVVAFVVSDRLNVEDASETAQALALCGADVLVAHLPEYVTAEGGTVWAAGMSSSSPLPPVEFDDRTLWGFSYACEVTIKIRYRRSYQPLYVPTSVDVLPWSPPQSVGASADVVAVGAAVSQTVTAGGNATLSLTAGELAATTAIGVDFGAGVWATGSALTVIRNTPPFVAGGDTLDALGYGEVAVSTVPIADGVDLVILVQDATTQATTAYRVTVAET
jgi:hypothetical protein